MPDKEDFILHNHRYGMTNKHLEEVFQKVKEAGQVTEEVVVRSRTGRMIPCEVRHLPLKFHSATSLLSYVRDLSAQKKNEEALRAAKDKAEVAAQAKSDFLANMSHEIRTPMNAMVGLIHLIKDSGLDSQQMDYLGRIEDSTRSLLRIINDVLDFSKIDAGRLEMEEAEFDLASLLREVLNLNLPLAWQKGLELILTETPNLKAPLLGDEVRLQQILNNLIGNALKFTSQGRVSLSVRLLDDDRDEGRVRLEFTVRDTGIGFGPEQAERLFVAFNQADTSTTRKYGGTGLGLAISKSLVELMGGEIWTESRPGEGAAFHFTARFKHAAGAALKKASDPAQNETEKAELAARIKGAKILLVEDNEVNQLVARRIMEKAGLMVSIADNGLRALESLEADQFDLVLMDIQMPEMDGLEATRRIRANPRWADLPVVAMTAHALPGDQESFIKAGMSGYVSKPFKPQELIAAAEQSPEPVDNYDNNGGKNVAAQIDRAAILENFMDDEELLFESIDLFLERIAARMATLKEGVEAANPDLFMPEAHTIKGMIGIFSTEAAFESAKKLELKGRDKITEGIDQDFKTLEDDLSSLIAALRDWRNGN